MNEHDNRLSELYKQSSQETPSAQVDRAVLDMARKSVHRKLYSPFGASWLVRGATVGVMVLGVLLVLTMPEETPFYEEERDVARDVPLPSRNDSELQKERMEFDEAGTVGAPLKRKQSVTEEAPRFDFYEILPKLEVELPDDEVRGRVQQAPLADTPASKSLAAPAEPAAGEKATGYYLQAGSFRIEQRAIELRDRLAALGYRASVFAVTLDDGVIYYRVRVGPYTQEADAVAARQQLDKLGLETRQLREE